MSRRTIAAVQASLLMVAIFASAASKDTAMRIKVLDSETHTVAVDDSGVPKNCDGLNYDAYCHSGKTEQVTNFLVVQEANEPPFRVACTIDAKWSRCVPLPKGETFDARREKHGITVYYQDDDGKPRKQFYALVAGDAKIKPVTATAAVAAPPAPVPAQKTAPAPAAAVAASKLPDTVKCSFGSTPAGAEVTLDGRYVGSTPSVLGLSMGTHVVVISMPGFAQWKRELSVVSGSELTVNAVLQKAQ